MTYSSWQSNGVPRAAALHVVNFNHLDWYERGACRGRAPRKGAKYDLFFPEPMANPDGPMRARIREAKQICEECPVLAECRAFSFEHATQITDGIWGGLTTPERMNERRKIMRKAQNCQQRR